MRLALAAGGILLLALLTWLLLRGIDTNASEYADTQRAFDDFALAEASIGRDVLQARAGLLGNYDVLSEAEEAMESAVSRIRLQVVAGHLDPKPGEALAAAVGQYEDLIERFKSGNALRQNSLAYVGEVTTDRAFGALGDQFAPSATALAAAVLRLARDPSLESARLLQQQINRFEAQAPIGGLDGEAAHALLAHARLLTELLPEVDQTLRALVASPTREPLQETRELLAHAQAAMEVTAQRSRVLLYVVALGLLVVTWRLGHRLWTRSLKIRRLVDANIIGIFIFDADARIVEANDAFLRIIGYDRHDLAAGALRWTELTPPDWRKRDEQWVRKYKASGLRAPIETEYFRKDGNRVPVLLAAATFDEGETEGVGFVLDLTERRRAEASLRDSTEALRRSQAYLAEAQELSHTGSAAYNDTTILYWSDEHYRIFGFDPRWGLPSREAAVGRIHPDDRERAIRERRRAVREKRTYKLEYRILLPDGTVKHIESTAQPKFFASGEFAEVVSTIIDVTERKRAEEERKKAEDRLRRSEAHLAEAQRLSRTGSSVYSETAILYWSEEAFRIWGFDPLQGLPSREAMLQRIHPDDRDRYRQETKDALREKRDCSIEFRIVLADGTVKDVEKLYRPVFSPSGELVEIIASGIDVTERKRAEQALRQLESDLAHMNRVGMMGELAASLAHEITQPIAAARNNARAALNFLEKRPPDIGELREALGCVISDADRAGTIVHGIRDHVNKAAPRKDRFDLNEVIIEVIILARSMVAKNGVSIQTRLTEGLAPVEGDRVQLQQVILNLVLNAAEAMSAVDEGSRELLISSEQSRTDGVLVAVRDSGPGLDPRHIEQVFEAFYTTKSGGLGMGLSICRSIIDAHGGRLWAEANAPRGAVFQFEMPSNSSVASPP